MGRLLAANSSCMKFVACVVTLDQFVNMQQTFYYVKDFIYPLLNDWLRFNLYSHELTDKIKYRKQVQDLIIMKPSENSKEIKKGS